MSRTKLLHTSKSPIDTSIPIPIILLAKTFKLGNKVHRGMDVESHCIVVGYCAVHLAKNIMKHTPSMYGCRTWREVAFICAVHDVGKCSPGFQRKLYAALGTLMEGMAPYDKEDKEFVTNHALVSQVALMDMEFNKAARIAGIHHGRRQNDTHDSLLRKYGGVAWQHVRTGIVNTLINKFQVDPESLINYEKIPFESLIDQYPVDLGEYRLTGLCVISDWVASDAFERHTDRSNIKNEDIENAFIDRGFVGFSFKKNLKFSDIFGEYKTENGITKWERYTPTAIQREAISFVRKNGPEKCYVFEEQTGGGKSELANYVAFDLNSRGLANGIIFALPTKATSNQMLTRFNEFLLKVVDDKSKHHVAKLIHGSSRLIQDYNQTNSPGSDFYSRSTTSMLLPFQVATVDQILMASMNVGYSGVRSYGLMGKVIIIDEVHSMDAYSSILTQMLIRLAVRSGATVIMLTATMNNAALARFALDYSANPFSKNHAAKTAFPRLSVIDYSGGDGVKPKISMKKVHSTLKNKKVNIQYGTTRLAAMEQAFVAYKQGGQVAWVDNVVDQAHDVYQWFIKRGVDENDIICLTSRNTGGWRRDNEKEWCDLLGKSGDRSNGRIVVGTQVIEQSLNIDFDVMFSLLAYTDSMIQRIGRLMRFKLSNRNPLFSTPLFVIVYPTDDFGKICDSCFSRRNRHLDDKDIVKMVSELRSALDKTRYVYEHHIFLMTTHRVWKNRKSISLPKDSRKLIDDTYDHKSNTGVYGWLQDKYHDTIDRMERMAYSRRMVTDAISTQLSHGFTRIQEDEDKIMVLMLKCPPNGNVIVLNDKRELASDTIDISELDSMSFAEKSNYIMAIEANMVSVPAKLAPPGLLSEIAFMSDRRLVYAGNADNEDHITEPMARFGVVSGGIVYDSKMRPLKIPCGLTKKIGFYRLNM